MCDICIMFVVPRIFRFLSAAWSLVAKKVEVENEHDGGGWISMAVVCSFAWLRESP